jgi:hypothetical protein
MFDTLGTLYIILSKAVENNFLDSGQKKKEKGTSNDLQNITQKTKDPVTRTPLKIGGELKCSETVSRSCSIRDTVVLLSYIYLIIIASNSNLVIFFFSVVKHST